ncbi:MAG: MFS transporter [Pseudomonadales bacterium]|nr:MFS transporter [Pseudomonadales bacterium]
MPDLIDNTNANIFPKPLPDSMLARLLLAFLATAGLFYVNIMPALVDGLVEGLGFTNKEAGLVGSSNVYGAAVGALLIVFLISRINWRTAAWIFLSGLIIIDAASTFIDDAQLLTSLRFLHGLIGGMLVGTGFAVIARTHKPDRTFGMLLGVQYGLGGLGIMVIPPLVPDFGTPILFLTLIGFSVVTALMLPFIPDYPIDTKSADRSEHQAPAIKLQPLSLTLLALFLFQAANMAVFAYIIVLGKSFGLDPAFIMPVLGAASWVGVLGALLVVIFSTRFGRLFPILVGMTVTLMATWLLHYSGSPLAFIIANCAVGITWAFIIAYLLGMSAEFDKAGRMAALGGFASKMGLASGPFVAALIVGDDNYALLVNVALVFMAISMIAAIIPARFLDREAN